jgi:predicted outer membrane protein
MKLFLALLSLAALVTSAGANEPEKKKPSTVPGPYPSIIKIPAPTGSPDPLIIQSELGGREMLFLQATNAAGLQQLALAELAQSKGGSEQIKAVAESIASTQATESREIARLATAKNLALTGSVGKTLTDELSALTGGKFEKAWVDRLIAVSEASAAAYEIGAKSQDADIRSFAEQMLPVAKARLQMANRLGGRSAAAPSEAAKPAAGGSPKPK